MCFDFQYFAFFCENKRGKKRSKNGSEGKIRITDPKFIRLWRLTNRDVQQ